MTDNFYYQTLTKEIEAILFDEIEKDEEERAQIVEHYDWLLANPDPLNEKDEQKLKEMHQNQAAFEEIRDFPEYLKYKNQKILGSYP